MPGWVDGDYLTPSNLNTKGVGAVFEDRTVNAANYDGATTGAKIAAAITDAATRGYGYAFVPKSMFGYDATQVTFNNSVVMLREGGPQNMIDPIAYGAIQDPGNINNTPAFQAALDAAVSNTLGIRTFWVPAQPTTDGNNAFYCFSPLWVKGPIRMLGDGAGMNNNVAASHVIGLFNGGPILALQGASAVVAGLVPALVGTGNAWSATVSNRWITLRHASPLLDLDGLSQLSIKAYVSGTGNGSIVTSGGHFLVNDPYTEAFTLNNVGTNCARFTITTSDGTFTALGSTTVINDNVRHEVWGDYDGTNVRVFVDGHLEATAQATGTISQGWAEDVTIGAGMELSPEQTLHYAKPDMVIDSIQMWDISKHTASFTSIYVKGTYDSHTLALLNFDATIGAFTAMDNKNTKPTINGTQRSWAWENDNSGPNYGFHGFRMEGVRLDGNRVCTLLHTSRREQFEWYLRGICGTNIRNGIIVFDGYDNGMSEIFLKGPPGIPGTAGGRYGMIFGPTGGIGGHTNLWTQAFQIHAFSGGGGVSFNRWFLQLDPLTHTGIVQSAVASSPPTILNDVIWNSEPGVSARYRASMLVGAPVVTGGIVATGCYLESGGTAKPWVVLDSCFAAFHSTVFAKSGGTQQPAIAHVQGTMPRPAFFDGQCNQPSAGWVPWSDVTGTSVLGRLGPLNSGSTGGTIRFDASVADEWDLTLTSNVTLSIWTNINYGQPVSGVVKMDSTGSRLFTWPTNSKGTVTLSYGSSAINTFAGVYDGTNVILRSVRTGL